MILELLQDERIDGATDRALRNLLSACYTKPEHEVFRSRRYFRTPYPRRWVVRTEAGRIVAQAGVHDREIRFDGRSVPIGGIGDVCVHPDFRGRGYVRWMLSDIHVWLMRHGFVFSVLFGRIEIYASSGYRRVDNLRLGSDRDGWTPVTGLVHELTSTPWPTGPVYLPGGGF